MKRVFGLLCEFVCFATLVACYMAGATWALPLAAILLSISIVLEVVPDFVLPIHFEFNRTIFGYPVNLYCHTTIRYGN